MLRLVFAWLGASLVAIVWETAWFSYIASQLTQLFPPVDPSEFRPKPMEAALSVAMQLPIYLALYVLPSALPFVFLAAQISRKAPKYCLAIFTVAGAMTMSLVLVIYALAAGNDSYVDLSEPLNLLTPLIGAVAGLAGGLIWRPSRAKPAAPHA